MKGNRRRDKGKRLMEKEQSTKKKRESERKRDTKKENKISP